MATLFKQTGQSSCLERYIWASRISQFESHFCLSRCAENFSVEIAREERTTAATLTRSILP